MLRLLKLPQTVVLIIDNPTVAGNFRPTTWIVFGALIFQLLACIFPYRFVVSITIGALLLRLIPALLVSYGLLTNLELQEVNPYKASVMFPRPGGSSGLNPSGEGIALLILGIRISHPLGILAPGAKATGDLFRSLVEDLDAHPSEHGWLGGSLINGRTRTGLKNDHLSIIGYFKTMEDLHKFAHGPMHRNAWNWWSANVKSMPHIGIYHEAYDVPANHWEAIYLQTPSIGLGRCKIKSADGQWRNLLIDAKHEIWRSSAGRMGRGEGKTFGDDPYLRLNVSN
ncbi:hypothetical protein BKA67DRAFT_645385 [Truncatella angustata]|uniref:Uncharacterized protein n=1 Tax=Truncatella angustata TaxID=152316 RepID=A0A9P9A0G1_9PEZI|nr:uncharacterized protein BKA67DRAFT_645385 [Truncatella angustata]KAH6655974.1 hypothetical protein BKA67DRAFT_645385 [Truncatella angustata]KAH8200932.1 hypothetical protein TruAng_004870 [Truncatella angustata]